MSPRVDLLRHGATAAAGYCGSTDVPLTEAGLQQMWNAVGDRRWDRIISSPLQRCAGFAQALSSHLGVPCSRDARLREMHFGTWEERTAKQLMVEDPMALERFWRDPASYPPPGAEPLLALQARVLDFWYDLAAEAAGERVLLVTHGGPIRILIGASRGMSLSDLLEIEVAHAALFSLRASIGESGAISAGQCVI